MDKEKNEKLAEISARITQVITFLGETPNSFATKLGYPRAQTIYDIQKMKSAPSYDFFQRFSTAGFSAIIDLDWLLTGNGTMLKEEQKKEEVSINTVDASCIYNMYKDYKNMQEKKDLEIKGLQTKIDELHAKIEKQNDTINILIAENKELEARLDVLDPLQLPPVGDVLQKKSLSSQIQPIASAPVRIEKRKSNKK